MRKNRLIILAAAVLCCLALAGCAVYRSSYRALLLVTSADSNSASMSFSEFEGTRVFKLKTGKTPSALVCSGQISEGEAVVYYDCGGGKTELLTLVPGDRIDIDAGMPEKTDVYVIFETDGKCSEGSLSVDIIPKDSIAND